MNRTSPPPNARRHDREWSVTYAIRPGEPEETDTPAAETAWKPKLPQSIE